MDGEVYAHIDLGGIKGNRVRLTNDGKWQFVDDSKDVKAWINRNGNKFILGVVTSVIAGVILYMVLKSKK